MSVEMKLGWWEDGQGGVWRICRQGIKTDGIGKGRATWSCECGRWWYNGGKYYADESVSPYDLIRYLGPIELSPSTASAEAGPAGASTVSTEDPQEQLQRMRDRYNAMEREASIYSGLLAALDQAKSDLYEAISRLEKEVEG